MVAPFERDCLILRARTPDLSRSNGVDGLDHEGGDGGGEQGVHNGEQGSGHELVPFRNAERAD